MAKAKSSFVSKMGNAGKKAFDSHKTDEVKVSNFGNLPGGISGGTARLVECKIDQYKKGDMEGEWYFMASGVVIEPKKFNGMRLEGMRTSIGPEPLCETPNKKRATIEDHLAWVIQELKKLGGNVDDIELEDLEDLCATLKEASPTFSFTTREMPKSTDPRYKDRDPMVLHFWNGVVEEEDETEEEDDVDDDSAKAPAKKPTAKEEEAAPPKKAGKAAATAKVEEEVEETEEFSEFEDIDSLMEAAESGDEEAQLKLKELGKAVGLTNKQIDSADSWTAVGEMIQEKQAESTEGAEEEDEAEEDESEEEEAGEEVVPEVEQTFLYKPKVNNPRTKAPYKSPISVEVVSVNSKKKTCSLKSLDNAKVTFDNVPWSELIPD